ncbi:carbohydrate ABC transporter permease [Paenibacillus montanisoli]|uniref:Carbohydrate ABC transporter permease n=1 Tax=Paenibacillus montanisoli TaxID=2081970 RepID=A0A328U270_9BACL|nr:carbohydrate ABC transporter permease [Paenibacillus montanisoli]RAP74094.1 carbohydrate ABC transporter permease [Paenibacillus montanisoli]
MVTGRKNALLWIHYLVCFIVAAAALFPIVWMAIAGFKSKAEVLVTPFRFFPKEWITSNYAMILKDPVFSRSMLITFVGAVIFMFLSIIIASLSAFAFARLEFPFKNTLFVYAIITMFIPGTALLIPIFIVVTKMHLLNTMAGLIIPGIASAGHMFFVRQFYLNIPSQLEEAALIDGSTRFGTYRHIFLPLSYPPFVIIGISSFLGYWNSYIWPVLIITEPKLFQVTQFIGNFRSERSSEEALLMAGGTLTVIPVILVFLFFQKHLVQGIKLSGIK